MNLMCKGSLDEDFVCITCDATFCKECERLKKSGHVCDKNDVDSIKEINTTVKCPNCKLAIFRSSGCDHMTCANCKQHFNFKTGEAGGAGGNLIGEILVKDVYKLHVTHEEYLKKHKLLDLVVKLELLEPKPATTNKINNSLSKLFKGKLPDDTPVENKLAKDYEAYIKAKELNKAYHNCINEIEELIKIQKLSTAYLDKAIHTFTK